jgi:hypothetical protein
MFDHSAQVSLSASGGHDHLQCCQVAASLLIVLNAVMCLDMEIGPYGNYKTWLRWDKYSVILMWAVTTRHPSVHKSWH